MWLLVKDMNETVGWYLMTERTGCDDELCKEAKKGCGHGQLANSARIFTYFFNSL